MNPKDHVNQNANGLPKKGKVIKPLDKASNTDGPQHGNPSLNIIRNKLDSLYDNTLETKPLPSQVQTKRSVHQQFMYELSTSGKSLADIQTEWHQYYVALPDSEKHQVWKEFYSQHKSQQPEHKSGPAPDLEPVSPMKLPASNPIQQTPAQTRTTHDIKQELLGHVKSRRKISKKDHFKSLLFGLSSGVIVIVIMLFGFFNERFLAPFITPSRNVSATPIIMDPSGTVSSKESKIIIPKINVEVPVVYDEPSIDEATIQRALEKGTVHYPTTSNPGEVGNGVIFGHSANNILNQGKYKFAFVLLGKLESGDTFYIQKDGKQYGYKVFDKKIVSPTEVSVLYPSFPDKPSTFTLITCDPPGTSLNRLVVTAEQISPDPTKNIASSAKPVTSDPAIIPSNAKTLWQRFTDWL